jgi:heme exporter protein B
MFSAAFRRECQLRFAKPITLLYPVALSLLIALCAALALGPQPQLLAQSAPAILFISLLIALFLAMEQLFEDDVADGTFDLMVARQRELLALLYAKLCCFVLMQSLALALAFPLLYLLLGLEFAVLPVTLLALLLSALALGGIGLVGAALMARLQAEQRGAGGALLQLLLVIPQSVPVVIFAAGAIAARANGESPAQALYFLAALAVLSGCVSPLLARLAIRAN